MIIRDLAGIDQIRNQIVAINPLLTKDLADVKRKWWYFGFWKLARNQICRRNNKVFAKHLPDNILLSVDVAYRLALHMTSVGNATDGLTDRLDKLHLSLHKLDALLKQKLVDQAKLEAKKAAVQDALSKKKADDQLSLGITLTSLILFPNPFSLINALFKSYNLATENSYQPYYDAIGKLGSALSQVNSAISQIKTNKTLAIDYITKANKNLVDAHDKIDLVLKNYGLVIDDRGLFVLKRGSWFSLPWKVSFGDSKFEKTPKNTYELSVLDVGVSPKLSQSKHFDAYTNRPPFNVSFLHHKTIQYLCKLESTRSIAADVRKMEMDQFAQRKFGKSDFTSTGKFVARITGPKKLSFPQPL